MAWQDRPSKWLLYGVVILVIVVLLVTHHAIFDAVTLTELSRTSGAILCVTGALMLVLSAWFYSHSSNAATGTFDLIEARKRNRGRWLLRGAAVAVLSSAISMLGAWYLLRRVAPHLESLDAGHSDATVLEAQLWHHPWDCGDGARVRLADGTELALCLQYTSRAESNYLDCIRAGDPVRISMRETRLGTLASIVDAPKSLCRAGRTMSRK